MENSENLNKINKKLTKIEEADYIIYEASNEADKLLYIRLRCGSGSFKALVDTGASLKKTWTRSENIMRNV